MSTFNFSGLQQKADQTLHNADEAVRKWVDFIQAPAGDVNFQYYDKNGNLKTVIFPNRNKVVNDFIANVNSVMNKTFYVDAINGNDNNDGSQSAPFKTIKKAVDSVPVGGKGVIYLMGSNNINVPQEYVINAIIELHNKTIIFFAYGDTHSVIKPQVSITVDGLRNIVTGLFRLNNSNIFIQGVNDWTGSVSVENPKKIDPNLDWAEPWNVATFTANIGYSSVYIRNLGSYGIKLYDSGAPLVKIWYADYRSFFTLSMANFRVKVENTNVKLVGIVGGGILGFTTNADIQIVDFTGTAVSMSLGSFISGIVRDTNGVPRNIVSNIVL